MNTVGYWFYWLFLYAAVCVLAALLGAAMAGSLVYNYDHRHHLAHYYETLNTWEWIAVVACSAPGFVCVALFQLWEYRKKQATVSDKGEAIIDDASVWPPPPKSD